MQIYKTKHIIWSYATKNFFNFLFDQFVTQLSYWYAVSIKYNWNILYEINEMHLLVDIQFYSIVFILRIIIYITNSKYNCNFYQIAIIIRTSLFFCKHIIILLIPGIINYLWYSVIRNFYTNVVAKLFTSCFSTIFLK